MKTLNPKITLKLKASQYHDFANMVKVQNQPRNTI